MASVKKKPTIKKSIPQLKEAKSAWTFFTNHAHILIILKLFPDSIIREIALKVGITERAVQKILVELEQEGFIKKIKSGRKNSYKLNLNKPLRHPVEKHKNVADVIAILTN